MTAFFTVPQFTPPTAHLIHFVFEWLAVLSGLWLYRVQRKHNPLPAPPLGVLIGCVAGAAVGNKALFLLEAPMAWSQYGWHSLLLGQTIVGGLLGGLLGIEIAKKLCHYPHSTGDGFILPLTLGIIIGRIGCFLAGLNDGTYGNPTTLPWGVDFGDGIARHPTQIYDQIAVIALAIVALSLRGHLVRGGAFKLFLSGYLLWRLLIDGIKPAPIHYASLSGIQLACLIALMLYLPLLIRDWKNRPVSEKKDAHDA